MILDLINFAQYFDRTALIDGDTGTVVTYAQLDQAIFQFTNAFQKNKALCFIFINSTIDDIVIYLSLLSLGHAVALFDVAMQPDLKRQLIEIYQPHFVIDSSDAVFSSTKQHSYELQTSIKSISIWKHRFVNQTPLINSKLQLLLSTSGTTGSPKLIRLTYENILANARSICTYLNITCNERAIASLPFHYSYGLSVLHTHLYAGASIVLTSQSIIQEQFWQIFDRFNCSSLAGVPYTYQLLDRLDLDQLKCPSLKTLTQAGGKLSSILVAKFHELMQRRQGRFFTMYGQTEATARIAYLPVNFLPEKAGAIGIAIPEGTLRLFNGDLQVTTPFNEGELVYNGPNVMLGYAEGSADLALGDQLHGVLRTGDLGYFDLDGIFYISGRIKRISKAYGQRINLDDIEQAASQFGNIIVTSNDLIIKIHYIKNSTLNTQECSAYLAKMYRLPVSIFEYIEIEQFPLTSSGKIDYTKL